MEALRGLGISPRSAGVPVQRASAAVGPATVRRRCPPQPAVRIGYLTNVYPAVSHSFIRREILALERWGLEIHRFTIRRAPGALPDPDDRAELAQTIALLDRPLSQFMLDCAEAMLRHPRRFLSATAMALKMGRASATGRLRHLIYLGEACLLAREAQRAGIRHIHVHFGTNPAAVARLAGVLADISYSMTVHGPDEFDAPAALSLPQKIADAAFTVAISDYGRSQLMRWSAVEHWPRIAVVRCGVDATFLAPEVGELQVPPPTLLCVARLSEQKGLPLLLEAVARVAAAAPWQLRVIGDGALRGELECRIAELGLSDRVVLLGWQSAAVVRAELLAARALVLPSFAEGLPVVLMEALALARPVIATAIAGVPELVDQSCGWLVPAGSLPRLVEAMEAALAASPSTLRALGQAGRERVRALHDAESNSVALAALLSANA